MKSAACEGAGTRDRTGRSILLKKLRLIFSGLFPSGSFPSSLIRSSILPGLILSVFLLSGLFLVASLLPVAAPWGFPLLAGRAEAAEMRNYSFGRYSLLLQIPSSWKVKKEEKDQKLRVTASREDGEAFVGIRVSPLLSESANPRPLAEAHLKETYEISGSIPWKAYSLNGAQGFMARLKAKGKGGGSKKEKSLEISCYCAHKNDFFYLIVTHCAEGAGGAAQSETRRILASFTIY
jgi:hypothetical protein